MFETMIIIARTENITELRFVFPNLCVSFFAISKSSTNNLFYPKEKDLVLASSSMRARY